LELPSSCFPPRSESAATETLAGMMTLSPPEQAERRAHHHAIRRLLSGRRFL
jgi:hypothetical protein